MSSDKHYENFELNKAYIEDMGEEIDIKDKRQLKWLRSCVVSAQYIYEDYDELDEMDLSWMLDKVEEVLNAFIHTKKGKN